MDHKYVKEKKLISSAEAFAILEAFNAYEIRCKQPFAGTTDLTRIDFITQEIVKKQPLLTKDNEKLVINGRYAPKIRRRAVQALIISAIKGLKDPNHKDLDSLVSIVKEFQEEYTVHAKGSEMAFMKLRAEVDELYSMKTSIEVHKQRLDQLYKEYENALKKIESMKRGVDEVKTSVLETNKAIDSATQAMSAFDDCISGSESEVVLEEPTEVVTIEIPSNRKKKRKTKKKVEKYISEHRRMRADFRSTRKDQGRRIKQLEKTLTILLDKQSVTDEMVRQLQKKIHK